MIFIADMSGLIHSFFHVRKLVCKRCGAPADRKSKACLKCEGKLVESGDVDDVTTRTLEKLERLREYYGNKFGPDVQFVAVFDNPWETFRHLLYEGYKADRTKHQDLPKILAATRDAVFHDSDWVGVDALYLLESDDMIASIAKQYHGQVVIYSDDRDFHSCLEKDRVTILKKANVDEEFKCLVPEYFSFQMFVEKFGFLPSQWVFYQVIVGDASDGLKPLSWSGAGDCLARTIVRDWGDPSTVDLAEGIKLNKTQTESYREFLIHYDLHIQLLTMRTNVPWPKEIERRIQVGV